MILMIKKIYIYLISIVVMNGVAGSFIYLCFLKLKDQLERRGLISMCVMILRGAIIAFLLPVVVLAIYLVYYVYYEDYSMFALSPILGWAFLSIGVIWSIGFLESIFRTIRIQMQMKRLRKKAYTCNKNIVRIKDQWKEEIGICKDVEIRMVYGLPVPMICGFMKPMILLPDRKYGTEELNIICIHELIHCKHRDILWKQLCEMIRMIHWWNPLVKQLNQNVDSWNETYCDLDSIEIVKSKKTYFNTICEIGISLFSKGAYLCAALAEDKNQLKVRIQRIKSIKNVNSVSRLKGRLICIGLSMMVAVVLVISVVGYHKIYVETVWATEETVKTYSYEEVEYKMDLKEYMRKVKNGSLETKQNQNIIIGDNFDGIQRLKADTRWETKGIEIKQGGEIEMVFFSSQEVKRNNKEFVAGIVDETGKERYVTSSLDIIHTFKIKEEGRYKVFIENRCKKEIEVAIEFNVRSGK